MTEATRRRNDRGVIRLVASREVRLRMRARSYYIFTGLLVVAILAMGVITRLTGDDGPTVTEVGVAEPAPPGLAAALAQAAEGADRSLEVTTFPDSGAARTAVDDDDVDVAILGPEGEALFGGDVDDTTFAIVQQAWATTEIEANLLDAGLSPDELRQALTPAPLTATSLDEGSDSDGLTTLTGTMAGILLYLSLQTFGTYVLTGVVEEKSTAVVEVLLVRARADQLLAGKVIGIGVAAVAQLAAALAAAVVALAISGTSVPGEVWSALPMTLVWFLGGYAFYSTLFALAGSLVSRQEDAQGAATPIMTLLIGAYFLIFVFGYIPDSTASRVLSLIPPIAPLLMPMRMAAGAASVVEVVVALVLLAAATTLVWKVAGRIYEQVLLHRGSRIPWKRALGMARHA